MSHADEAEIWSSSEVPYLCLIDTRRTEALRRAIRSVVKPGDVVVDAGAGSGILSFFAAKAGARAVYAVEIDPFLAECLRRSVLANGFEQTIQVLHGDLRELQLPQHVDVVLGEMIDTGLIEELQLDAINSLHERKIIGANTRVVPCRYQTYITLGHTSFEYYGFKVLAPRHDHPDFPLHADWYPTTFAPFHDPVLVSDVDFFRLVPTQVDQVVSVIANCDGRVNAVRISGRAELGDDAWLEATNSVNGEKTIPLREQEVDAGQVLNVHVRYCMGGGISRFSVELV